MSGGEPLLRRDLETQLEMLAAIPGVDPTLTTNSALLARKAQALKDAGLERITVSLDSLDDETFRTMNDVDFPVERVLAGIDAALAAGLAPVKVNVVVKRGVNEEGLLPMARAFRGTGVVLRFIVKMSAYGVGLARYATDIRTNKDSGSATNTAMRFAEGKTTVEVFE